MLSFDTHFSPHNRGGYQIHDLIANGHIKRNEWNFLTATYDYDNDRESLYKNGQVRFTLPASDGPYEISEKNGFKLIELSMISFVDTSTV